MNANRCANCRHLDRNCRSDIGGLPIAVCTHPQGVAIGGERVRNSFVALDFVCDQHQLRVWATVPAKEGA